MGMTVPQKKYLMTRIDEILWEKVGAIEKMKLSGDRSNDARDFSNALKNGTLSLISESKMTKLIIDFVLKKIPHYQTFHSSTSIALDDIVENLDKWFLSRKDARAEIYEQWDNKILMITAEATRVKDEAMFGNEQEAHEMLKQFSALSLKCDKNSGESKWVE